MWQNLTVTISANLPSTCTIILLSSPQKRKHYAIMHPLFAQGERSDSSEGNYDQVHITSSIKQLNRLLYAFFEIRVIQLEFKSETMKRLLLSLYALPVAFAHFKPRGGTYSLVNSTQEFLDWEILSGVSKGLFFQRVTTTTQNL